MTKIPCAVNTRERPCSFSPGLHIILHVDLPRPYLQVQQRDARSNRVIMEQTVSLCKLLQTLGLDIFMKLGVEVLRASVDFEIGCPFKKVKEAIGSLALCHKSWTIYRANTKWKAYTTQGDSCWTFFRSIKPSTLRPQSKLDLLKRWKIFLFMITTLISSKLMTECCCSDCGINCSGFNWNESTLRFRVGFQSRHGRIYVDCITETISHSNFCQLGSAGKYLRL